MAAHDSYRAQVELLIRCLPAVASAPDLVLKGGTAINLFLRDMPRLSVDIDLTYLPASDRDTALTDIRSQLATIAEGLKQTVPGTNVQLVEGDAPKLLVDLAVTQTGLDKAITFANELFLALEARDHRVVIAPNSERFHRAKVDERENPGKGHHHSDLWSPMRCSAGGTWSSGSSKAIQNPSSPSARIRPN